MVSKDVITLYSMLKNLSSTRNKVTRRDRVHWPITYPCSDLIDGTRYVELLIH